MYDHQTESLWHNLTGEPVVGSLAKSGLKLKVLPVTITSWENWLRDHPDTKVLDINTGHQRDYTPGQPYGNYFSSPKTMFPVFPRDQRLATKSYVFAIQLKGQPKAYPIETIGKKKIINDTHADVNLVIVGDAETRTVRAYERGNYTFTPGNSPTSLVEQKSGERWQIQEEQLVNSKNGEKLPRLGGHVSYWFGWYAFYPRTEIYME
jgi:hypothetical protein